MITRGILVRLHLVQSKTPEEIGAALGCSTVEVYQALIKYEVMHPAAVNDEIVARFEAGQSELLICHDMGLSRQRVGNVIHTTGHEHRSRNSPRGGAVIPAGGEVIPADADTVTRYNNGASIRKLAADAGISYGAMHRRLSDADVTFRSRGGYHRTR